MSVCGLLILATVLGQAPTHVPEAAAIEAAKKAIVREIDPALPRTTFEAWLRSVVGAKAEIKWEVNDCGEQTGSAGSDKGRDFPMCAQVQVQLGGNRELCLLLSVGTLRKGVTAGPPQFYFGYLTDSGGPPMSIKNLAQVPAMIRGDRSAILGRRCASPLKPERYAPEINGSARTNQPECWSSGVLACWFEKRAFDFEISP